MAYPEPNKVKRELKLIIYTDDSIEILNQRNEAVTFFADEVIALGIIRNLEELGEL